MKHKGVKLQMDWILNGAPTGAVAQRIMACGGDIGVLRPWVGEDGRTRIALVDNSGKLQTRVVNGATATLRKDEWKVLDSAVVKVAEPRLKFVGDLRSRGLTFNVPNGLAKTVLETESMSDAMEATISMDGLRRGVNDRPEFELTFSPLPIIHADFGFSMRQIMTSRNGGTPLDTSGAERAGRKVAETAEQLAIGSLGKYTFGGGSVYGITNFPDRITTSITSPEDSAWTHDTLVDELLGMRQALQDAHMYGPYQMYFASAWDRYLDKDYSTSKGDNTLRERIEKIAPVMGLDYLSNYDVLMIQMTSDVIREVIGMDVMSVQWESEGGMALNYKVMAILVPQPRSDFEGQCGINHASA